ncbi:hypothetical protein RRSWK_05096 [Rhodopirellula sp. SWK7]|nr:hypothetical protein RRSWK_05096 [Rhodopirellula sp. SWK7]
MKREARPSFSTAVQCYQEHGIETSANFSAWDRGIRKTPFGDFDSL